MIDLLKRLLLDRKGSSLVMVSISMVVIVAFCSLVVDMGNLFLTRNRLSNALDAAVLAACHELPRDELAAVQATENYFVYNGLDPSSLTGVEVSEDKRTVSANGRAVVQFFLARVLGINSETVACTAAARIYPLAAARGVAPLGIKNQELEFGVKYTLKISPDSDQDEYLGPGNFGVLQLGGPGSNIYEKNLKYGFDGKIKVGDELFVESGNKSGATRDGVNYRVGQCTHSCTPYDFDPSCPRIILIPVYQPETVQNNKVVSVRVVGFAAFLIEKSSDKIVGNECYVDGYFIQLVVEGEGDEETSDYGLYAVRLIE